MKPLNKQERTTALIKFILTNLLVIAVTGYAIYSFVFVKENISTEIKVDTNEVKALEDFITKADTYTESFAKADTDIDRAKFSLELNRLIMDSKDKFSTNELVFKKISERYKSSLRSKETIAKMGAAGEASCADKTKALEDEIKKLESDLKDMEKDQGTLSKETRQVKSTIERISSDLVLVADEINAMDWCPGVASGGGRKEIKSELKQRLGSLRNELLKQAVVLE